MFPFTVGQALSIQLSAENRTTRQIHTNWTAPPTRPRESLFAPRSSTHKEFIPSTGAQGKATLPVSGESGEKRRSVGGEATDVFPNTGVCVFNVLFLTSSENHN